MIVRFVLVFFIICLLFDQAAHCENIGAGEKHYAEIKVLAESGDAEAQFGLALMLDIGDNVSRDQEKGVYWLKKAAKQNLPGACFYLGIKYEFGNTVPRDISLAAYWYERAALQDWPMAQFHLGFLHLPGNGLDDDPVSGFVWLTLAAEHGYPDAAETRDHAGALLSAQQKKQAGELLGQLRQKIQQHTHN